MCMKHSHWCDLQSNGRDCCWYYERHVRKRRRYRNSIMAKLIARDGAECRYCGSDKKLTKDHIVPRSKGGPDSLANLQILCTSCNNKKGDRDEDDPKVKRLKLKREQYASVV